MQLSMPLEKNRPLTAPAKRRSRVRDRVRTPALCLLLSLFALAVLLHAPIRAHIDAADLLTSFASKDASTPLIEEDIVSIPTARGPVRGRVFVPPGIENPPAMVIVHGVHYKGIEEPRLLRFSRAVASEGFLVLTPEVSELADYHVDPRSIDTIGASVLYLKERAHKSKVSLMGLSFGGGLSLLAASDPRFRDSVSVVVAVGAHDDVPRVSRFFAHQPTTFADGRVTTVKPHDYGATVLVYDRISDFFPKEEEETAKSALRHWLREEQKEAARGRGEPFPRVESEG